MDIEFMKQLIKLIEDSFNNEQKTMFYVTSPFIAIPIIKSLYYYYKYSKIKNRRSLTIDQLTKGLNAFNPDKYFKWMFRKSSHTQIKAKNQIIQGYIQMHKSDIIQCTQRSLFYQLTNNNHEQALTKQYKIKITDQINLRQYPDKSRGAAIIQAKKNKPKNIRILGGLLKEDQSQNSIRQCKDVKLSWIVNNLKLLFTSYHLFFSDKVFMLQSGNHVSILGDIIYDFKTKQVYIENIKYMFYSKPDLVDYYFQKISRNIQNLLQFVLFSGLMFVGYKYMKMKIDKFEKMNQVQNYKNVLSQCEVEGEYDGLKCIICLENFKEIVFLPCKHLDVCAVCFQMMLQKRMTESCFIFKCPMCNNPVDHNLIVVGKKNDE